MRLPSKRFQSGGKVTSRRRVLSKWRGVDLTPLEIAQADNSKAAGNLVGQVLGGLKMDQKRAEIEIVRVWNNLIDPTLVAHAQPAGIHKCTLFVNVDSSAWLSEIVRLIYKISFNMLIPILNALNTYIYEYFAKTVFLYCMILCDLLECVKWRVKDLEENGVGGWFGCVEKGSCCAH